MKRPKITLDWRGPAVESEIEQRATRALTEIDLRIEAASKTELYPGHGVVTGMLRRSIEAIPVRKEGRRLIGGVGTHRLITLTKAKRKHNYALIIHRRYLYITRGLKKIRPQVGEILQRHMEG